MHFWIWFEKYIKRFIISNYRGKNFGHDIDILMSYPILGEEKGVLNDLLKLMIQNNLILHARKENESFKSQVSRFLVHTTGEYKEMFVVLF